MNRYNSVGFSGGDSYLRIDPKLLPRSRLWFHILLFSVVVKIDSFPGAVRTRK